MIYGYNLPTDRTMRFPASQYRSAEETIIAICAIDDRINDEMMDALFKECGAYIVVKPDAEMGLPLDLGWDRFRWIEIKIDYYQAGTHGFKTNPPWAGMRELIARLRCGYLEMLPPIDIEFYEDNSHNWSGKLRPDRYWTQDMPTCQVFHAHGNRSECYPPYRTDSEDDDDEADKWLRSTGDRHRISPIAIDILDHFLELPPCMAARVSSITCLDGNRPSRMPRYDPDGRLFDRVYMDDCCRALGFWLDGDRNGIKMPIGEGEEHGEPRLEQIAYQVRKNVWYCDSDLEE